MRMRTTETSEEAAVKEPINLAISDYAPKQKFSLKKNYLVTLVENNFVIVKKYTAR